MRFGRHKSARHPRVPTWTAAIAVAFMACFAFAPASAAALDEDQGEEKVSATDNAESTSQTQSPVVAPEPAEAPEEPEAPAAPSAQRGAVQPSAPAAPVTAQAAYDPSGLGITVTPATVRQGENFTFELSGCPFIADGNTLLQMPVVNPVTGPDGSIYTPNMVLGGVHSGMSGTGAGDPWVHSSTVAADATPGVYRISPQCQTRETVNDSFSFHFGQGMNLTVLGEPTVTIDPAQGHFGDQFTATIADCPSGRGPQGISITQSALDHSGPASFGTAFQYVSAEHNAEPKPYVWQVKDTAAPGEYTLVFSCYTEPGEEAEKLNPVTFTVLPDFELEGSATIDPSSGYPGDEFTITGTGCPDGSLELGDFTTPGDMPEKALDEIDGNTGSGEDPMWSTLTFDDTAPPGDYTFHPVCRIGDVDYPYKVLEYTLLERETPTPTDPGTPFDDEIAAFDDVIAADSAGSDPVSAAVTTQVLPETGSPVTPPVLLAGISALLIGLGLVAASRRRV